MIVICQAYHLELEKSIIRQCYPDWSLSFSKRIPSRYVNRWPSEETFTILPSLPLSCAVLFIVSSKRLVKRKWPGESIWKQGYPNCSINSQMHQMKIRKNYFFSLWNYCKSLCRAFGRWRVLNAWHKFKSAHNDCKNPPTVRSNFPH